MQQVDVGREDDMRHDFSARRPPAFDRHARQVQRHHWRHHARPAPGSTTGAPASRTATCGRRTCTLTIFRAAHPHPAAEWFSVITLASRAALARAGTLGPTLSRSRVSSMKSLTHQAGRLAIAPHAAGRNRANSDLRTTHGGRSFTPAVCEPYWTKWPSASVGAARCQTDAASVWPATSPLAATAHAMEVSALRANGTPTVER